MSTLAMYALLPVVVLMERKYPPADIVNPHSGRKASHSKFTCDALLKCRCLCPAAAKTPPVPDPAPEGQDSRP